MITTTTLGNRQLVESRWQNLFARSLQARIAFIIFSPFFFLIRFSLTNLKAYGYKTASETRSLSLRRQSPVYNRVLLCMYVGLLCLGKTSIFLSNSAERVLRWHANESFDQSISMARRTNRFSGHNIITGVFSVIASEWRFIRRKPGIMFVPSRY